jgi:hypothetical protein
MANTIKIKRSATQFDTPADLEYGELAINYYDGFLFYKDTNGDIQYFIADTGYYASQSSSPSSTDNEILQWMGI